MRILVAGGQGQVGSELARQGLEQDLDLIALGRQELDITSSASIASVFSKYEPDLLINAAAYTGVDKAEREPELAYVINETGTALLADACAERFIPMFHLSTDYVFDGLKDGLYVETDPVNPNAVYAKSKAAGESLLRARLEKHIVVRTSWVFGEAGSNFVKTMLCLAKSRTTLKVVADQLGGPTSARSIAEVLLKIADQYAASGSIEWGTYHYCQLPYVSWYQFAATIIEQAADMQVIEPNVEIMPLLTPDFPTPVKRPANSRLDSTKIYTAFAISPSSWVEDIDAVIGAAV